MHNPFRISAVVAIFWILFFGAKITKLTFNGNL
jgi:hypothetical protein